MKTKTFKMLICALILLQVISIGSLVWGVKVTTQQESIERDTMLSLLAHLSTAAALSGDYELAFALSEPVENEREYEETKRAVFKDLDMLESLNAGNPQRLELIKRQRKMIERGDVIVRGLREAVIAAHGERSGAFVFTMLAGIRKLNKIMHELSSNFDVLVANKAPSGVLGIPGYVLIAALCELISLAIGAVLLLKQPSY